MRSVSTSLTLGGILLLSACARPAPPLPATGAAAAAMFSPLAEDQRAGRCTTLAAEIAALRTEMLEIEQVMQGRRTRDQVTAYLAAVLYPPLLSSIDQQRERKKALNDRQRKIDERLVERQARRCPDLP